MLVHILGPVAFACTSLLSSATKESTVTPVAEQQLVEHESTVHWLPSAECLASESGVFVSIDEAIETRLGPRLVHGLQAYWEDCAGTRHWFIREGDGALFAHVPSGHTWYLTVNMSGADLGDDEVLALIEALHELEAPGLDLYRTFAWSDAASAALARCEHLEVLRLGWSVIYQPPDTRALVVNLSKAFRRLTRLRELELFNFPSAESTLLLGSVPKTVERLTLSDIHLDREAVEAVLGLPRLCWLTLDGGIRVPEGEMVELLAMRSLRRFDERFAGRNTPGLRAALNASELQMLSVDSDDLAIEVVSTKPESLKSLQGLALSVDELQPAQLEALLTKTPRLTFLGLYDVRPTRDWLGTMAAAELPGLEFCLIEGVLDASSLESLQTLIERDTILRVIMRCQKIEEELSQLARSPKGQKLVLYEFL